MAFVRWDPLHELLSVQRMNRLATGPTGWTPQVDVYETSDRYLVMVELPGLSEGDVQLQHHDGQLTISGVRHQRQAACEQYHRIERGYGSFSRTFQLPQPVETERIIADLRDGVLTVTCPKASENQAHRIQIS